MAVGGTHKIQRNPREAIQQNALLRLIEAAQRLALGVNQSQFRGQLLENSDSSGLIVDEDPPLAGAQNLAAQDDLGSLSVDAVLFQDGLRARRGLEDTGDDCLVRAVAHHLDRGLAAHQQGQRVHQNRLAGAGFTRKQVEPRSEDGDGVIDDSVVFSAQLDKHRGPCSVYFVTHYDRRRNGLLSAA